MFVVVAYDVPARRTELYRKLLSEFLVHEQASVFMGDLPESGVVRLTAKIAERIEPEDRVLKLLCRNRHNVLVQRLSKAEGGGPMSQVDHEWHGRDWTVL